MSQFGGLWKQQNNPACTESVSLHNAEVGYCRKEDQSDPLFRWPVSDLILTHLLYIFLIHADPFQWYLDYDSLFTSFWTGSTWTSSNEFLILKVHFIILIYWPVSVLFLDYDSLFTFFFFYCEQFMWFLDYDTAHLYLLLSFALFFFFF